MNERAIKLYEEATEFAYKTVGKEHAGKSYFQGVIAGKFAELIVRECVMLCDKVYEQNDNVKIQAGATFCREDIKEHFGVEE